MRARQAFFWAAIGQGYAFVINFGGSVVVARLLDPAEMGIYVLGVATLGVISAFTSLGVGTYVIRETQLSDEIVDSAFTLNACLALFLALTVVIMGRLSTTILGSAEAGRVLEVLSIAPILGIFYFHPATMLQRELRFGAVALVNALSATVGICVTIACAVSGQSYMSPAWGGLAMTVTMLLAYVAAGRQYLRIRVGLSRWRAILTFGLRMVTIGGAAMITAKLADIILGRLLGLRMLGLYARASGLSAQIFDNIYGTATRVVFPHLSQQFRTTGDLKQAYLRSFRMISGTIWPLLFGLAVLSPVVIQVLYGDKWNAAAAPLSVLLLAQVVAIFFGMNWELFVIKDETALQTRIELLRSLTGLSVFAIGCTISLTAAAAGRFCDNLLAFFLYRKHLSRLSGASQRELNSAYLEGMMLSACAAGPAALCMIAEGWSAYASLPLVGVSIVTGIVFWLACMSWLQHPLIEEIVSLVIAFTARFRRRGTV